MQESYETQADKFLEDTGTKLTLQGPVFKKHFSTDEHVRAVYVVTLSNSKGAYTFEFGDSLMHTAALYYLKNYVSVGNMNVCAILGDRLTDEQLLQKAKRYAKKPTAYGILSCLQKQDVGSFEEFCGEFGYDEMPLSKYNNIKSIYDSCATQYKELIKLFNEQQMEALQEIN